MKYISTGQDWISPFTIPTRGTETEGQIFFAKGNKSKAWNSKIVSRRAVEMKEMEFENPRNGSVLVYTRIALQDFSNSIFSTMRSRMRKFHLEVSTHFFPLTKNRTHFDYATRITATSFRGNNGENGSKIFPLEIHDSSSRPKIWLPLKCNLSWKGEDKIILKIRKEVLEK